ncbi:MAG: helix-turn-helix transcriptional regulator [Eubacteriaceae bacterium]
MSIILRNPVEFRRLLIKSGYTQRGFGRAINISEPYANQIVNGERNPGPAVAKRICNILNIKFEDIFFNTYACKSEQKNNLFGQ